MRLLKNTKSEKQKIIDMWKYCFSDSDKFIDWNFSRNFKFSQTLVTERNGEIAANLQIIPYTSRINDTEMPSVYFSGVACLPQFRCQGCVRELMQETLKMLKTQKIPIAHLIPFNFGFYEKYGFKAISDKYTLNLPLDKIPYSKIGSFRLFNSIDNIDCDTLSTMMRIYNKMCENADFQIIRTIENFKKIFEDVLLNSGGYLAVGDESYILYETDADKMTAYELAFSSSKGLRQALAFIGSHKAERKFAEITTYINPIIKTELCDIRNMLQTNPCFMLRIIDAEYVLGILAKNREQEFCIEITDNIISENNACFKLSGGTVTKIQSECLDIKTDITILSQLICGYITLSEACEIGAAIIKSPDALEKLKNVFNKSENYINLML